MDIILNNTGIALHEDKRAPEVAITALISAVRLVLVTLICVLLFKLRAPVDSIHRKTYRNRRDGDNRLDGEQVWEEQTSQKNSERSRIYIRILIKFSKLISPLVNQQKRLETEAAHDGPSKTRQAQRRISQPNLISADHSRPEAGLDRRRRHSDSCLAHLNLPPGPMGLPFLGYLPFVGQEFHLTLSSLSERYGPIYQIYLGGIRVVVLNDAALVRQAFKQPVFSGRPDTQLIRILQGYGIVNSDGDLWREQRAFLHTALRKLGAKSLMNGANGLEAKIQVSTVRERERALNNGPAKLDASSHC